MLHPCQRNVMHTKLLIRVRVRGLHGIVVVRLVGLDGELVSQLGTGVADVGAVVDIAGDWGGVVLGLVEVFGFSFKAVGHFVNLICLTVNMNGDYVL